MCTNKLQYMHAREYVRCWMQGNKQGIVNTNILTFPGQWKLRLTMEMI